MKRDPENPPVVVFWAEVCNRLKVPVIYASIQLPDFRNRPADVVFRMVMN